MKWRFPGQRTPAVLDGTAQGDIVRAASPSATIDLRLSLLVRSGRRLASGRFVRCAIASFDHLPFLRTARPAHRQGAGSVDGARVLRPCDHPNVSPGRGVKFASATMLNFFPQKSNARQFLIDAPHEGRIRAARETRRRRERPRPRHLRSSWYISSRISVVLIDASRLLRRGSLHLCLHRGNAQSRFRRAEDRHRRQQLACGRCARAFVFDRI
jgi:hypothetical protein